MTERAAGTIWTWPQPQPGDYLGLVYEECVEAGWRIETVAATSPWPLLRSRDRHLLHVHWPEYGHRGRGLVGAVGVVARLALVALARLRGSPVLWTIHNLRPHEPTPVGRLAYSVLKRLCTAWVTLTDAAADRIAAEGLVPRERARGIVPHPLYDVPDGLRTLAPEHDVGFIGRLHPYKGVGRLVDLIGEDLSVLVVGEEQDARDVDDVLAALEAAPNVEVRRGRPTDVEYDEAIASCRVIVVPFIEVLHSGTVVHALSAHRPVVTTDSSVTREWRDACGASWVHLVSPGASVVDAVQRAVRDTPPGSPELSSFTAAGARMLDVIETVAAQP